MQEANAFISVAGFPSETEKATWEANRLIGFPQSHPGSIFIATAGTMWKPGCWEKVVDMLMFTRRQGLQCWLKEVLDPWDTDPYLNLGKIRDAGILKGKMSAMANILLIDCDVEPEIDTAINLLRYDLPVVVPYIASGVTQGACVGRPEYSKGKGIQRIQWSALSFILYNARIFNCVDNLNQSATVEMDLFEKLEFYGHHAYMDTSLELKLASHATRFTTKTWDERQAMFKEVDERRRVTPDRMPLDPMSPYIKDGIYAPYLIDTKEELEEYYSYLERKTQPKLIAVGANHRQVMVED